MELFYLLITLMTYVLFTSLSKKFKSPIFNPLLLSSIAIIIGVIIFKVDLNDYASGTNPLTMLLAPATVSLALPLYKHKDMILKYFKVISISVISGVISHAIILLTFIKLFQLDNLMAATLLPKSVTSGMGIDIVTRYGGYSEIALAVIVVTGILGALVSITVFKLLNVQSPISKGLALGASAHAVGTSRAYELGEAEGTMSSIAMILTGLLTVIVIPIIMMFL